MSVKPTDLQTVDYLEVRVLVDNVMDILSTVPENVTSEIPNRIAAGASGDAVVQQAVGHTHRFGAPGGEP